MSLPLTVQNVRASLQNFGWTDYSVFVLMLAVCMGIGLYFSPMNAKKRRGRQNDAMEYLLGDRKMKLFPVTVSLIASGISGIAVLGTSTEVYLYGAHYAFLDIGVALGGVVMYLWILPVFYELELVSIYDYLGRRFDSQLRLFGSVLYLLNTVRK